MIRLIMGLNCEFDSEVLLALILYLHHLLMMKNKIHKKGEKDGKKK